MEQEFPPADGQLPYKWDKAANADKNFPRQSSIFEHLQTLRGARAWIVCPRKQRQTGEFVTFLKGPHHPAKLKALKKAMNGVDPTIRFQPDFYYLANRDHTQIDDTSSGRVLFQYDPSHKSEGRVGRLII